MKMTADLPTSNADPDPTGSRDASTPQLSWGHRVDAGLLLLVSYAGFFLASKMIGFTPGYGLDDYGIIRRGAGESLVDFFLSQGRYGSALMDVVLHASNLTMASFSTIGLAATAFFSGLFFKDALDLPKRSSPILAVGIGALLGSHPYYAEYVSFRQAALPMSAMFLSLWAALRLYRLALEQEEARVFNVLASLFAMTLAMGFNQLAVSYMSIAVLCVHMQRLQMGITPTYMGKSAGSWAWLEPIIRAMLIGAVLIATSTIVAKMTMLMFGLEPTQRAELIGADMLGQRSEALMGLVQVIWADSETVAGWPAKILALAGFFVLLASSLRGYRRAGWLSLVTFLAATAAALIPTAASTIWWPVPRTLIAVPFALAAAIALLAARGGRLATLAGVLLVASAGIFSAHSTQILSNQQRLNRWDQMQARDITQMAAGKFSGQASKLALVDSDWGHDVAREIAQGDLNISALSVAWALDPLFDEATGSDQTVRLAPEFSEFCSTSPKYPDPASLHLENGEVVVCMQ
ncbi:MULTISPECIES: hypothetical protein [unclassified Stenotrophomonas]|uniref:hypothetical protein n=1 Tax=unclassified Stenotrophomonas TaxID=196198 RepID=UPI0012FF45D0|nr:MULTISPECIES: hypothetical protein [unclassified Stenotrophomonas]